MEIEVRFTQQRGAVHSVGVWGRKGDSQPAGPTRPPCSGRQGGQRRGRGDGARGGPRGRRGAVGWFVPCPRHLPGPRVTPLSRPGTQGARRGPRCHYDFRHQQRATLSGEQRHLTNVSTNVLKDTLTDDKSQRSFRPLAAAKVWKRGLGGDRKALQEPELIRVHSGSWSSGCLCVWRQERGWLGVEGGEPLPLSRATRSGPSGGARSRTWLLSVRGPRPAEHDAPGTSGGPR